MLGEKSDIISLPMPKNLLVRNVPENVLNAIHESAKEHGVSKQVAALSVLQTAFGAKVVAYDKGRHIDLAATARNFTFIDLFAGIGGFRIALEEQGGRCVFSSEWDKHARKTYEAWFGDLPTGDIREVDVKSIPDHFILTAGFPCQPFSIAGVSKKNSMGRAHGFEDVRQGNLFFYIVDIVKAKRPPVLLLENVKNLKSHDKGNTWNVIKTTLEGLGYEVHAQVLDAAKWVPQHRERVFIVCFNKKVFGKDIPYAFPVPKTRKNTLTDLLEKKPEEKYTLTAGLWSYLQKYAEKHKKAGNGFGFGIADLAGVTRTLSARYYKDGSEILIDQGKDKAPRRLTPKECQQLMGYPKELPIVVSDTQAYRQFGNGVVVPVVRAVAGSIFSMIDREYLKDVTLKCYDRKIRQAA